MGAHYDFRCDRCGYSAEISGGADFGYVTRTKTALCLDCNALVDVVTETRSKTMAGDVGRCPLCRGARIAEWESSGCPCPRCEGRMIKGELTALWD
ncbi:MAG: hypothetical protein Q8M76_01335 [Spirochaetaceae bacterium]|nr:hypothetical protein [Spirochaetaceae bacterium]